MKRTDEIKKDNRGLSIVELVVVIAIMAVLLGLIGLSIRMLVGADASQAARKMDAQLNDIKTGSMSRAGEYMILRYIDVDYANKATQKAMAELGVDKSGYYTEKHISTITNGDAGSPAPSDPSVAGSVKVDYGGVEYSRISNKRVEITVNTTVLDSAGSTGALIEYDRKTGRLYDVKIVDITGTVDAPSYTVTEDSDHVQPLEKITFKSGIREFVISFIAETGKHKLESN